MTKVLVTGATGFIGKFLISHLISHGFSVRILTRKYQEGSLFKDVEQHIGDLTCPRSLQGMAEGIETVFHLGGYAHAWNENQESAEQHWMVNAKGTENVLSECTRANIKAFILFSTIKAVADAPHCINETWDHLPSSPYGKAKRFAEEQVLLMGKEHPIHVCILRLALVYGPGLKGNLLQMLKAIDKKYFLPLPCVHNHRSLVSVYDICTAALLCAYSPKANGKLYYVCEQNTYSTYQIYESMHRALGRPLPSWHVPMWFFKLLAASGNLLELLFKRRFPFNTQAFDKLFGSSQYSASRIQTELGFTTQYDLDALLPSVIENYRTTMIG